MAEIRAILSEICHGLDYPSESDEPIAVVDFPRGFSIDSVSRGAPWQSQPVDDFFAPLTEYDDRFLELRQVMEQHLHNLAVYRIGRRRVEVYLVGQTPAGTWIGLRTISVET